MNLKLVLKNKGSNEEKDNTQEDTLDLYLDLAAFDKLRFNVAKAVSCSEAYTQNYNYKKYILFWKSDIFLLIHFRY